MMRLHLGCWKRNWPGFINIDLADYPHIHHRRSVDDLSIIDCESVDLIYASHVLEYFRLDEVPRVLSEWRRVLKFGGQLYVAVPDFAGLANAYNRTGDVRLVQGPLLGGMDIIGDGGRTLSLHHRVVYDSTLLRNVLRANGFDDVQPYDWNEIIPQGQEDHSMAYIPSRDYKNGISVSLNMKSRKASATVASVLGARQKLIGFGERIIRKSRKILK